MIKLAGESQIITGDEVLCVTRTVFQGYVDGKPTYAEPKVFKIKGNVQPLNGRELLIVPEADRFKEQYWIFTEAGLLVSKDRVVRCDVNFEVQDVESWGSYSRCRIMRIDVGPAATP